MLLIKTQVHLPANDPVFHTLCTNDKLASCIQAQYDGTRRIEETSFIHISALRQFFLNCYVSSSQFMSLLMLPFKTQVWISEGHFLRSFENIQSHIFEALDLYADNPRSAKKLFAVQKLFCEL
jgi:hypothetical protein